MWTKITKTFAALAGAAAGFFGGWNIMLTGLVWFMGIDYLTGLICAWRGQSPKTENGGVSSRAGFDGLLKKGVIMLVVLTATLLDKASGTETAVFQTAAAAYYIANEGISILEISARLGVPYPPIIKNALEELSPD